MDINLLNYLNEDCVLLGLKPKNKRNALSAILDHLIGHDKIKKDDKKGIFKALLQREEMGSTAIGGHIALPHARLDLVKEIIVCLVVLEEGVDFDSLDEEPVNVIILLLSNQKEAGLHLKMLAFLARLLRDRYFLQQLKSARDKKEVLDLINKQQHAIR